jgi:hypothetical protein
VNAPFDELPDTAPPHPASTNKAGKAAMVSARAVQYWSEWVFISGVSERVGRLFSTNVVDVFSLNSSSAFLAMSRILNQSDAILPSPVRTTSPGIDATDHASRYDA